MWGIFGKIQEIIVGVNEEAEPTGGDDSASGGAKKRRLEEEEEEAEGPGKKQRTGALKRDDEEEGAGAAYGKEGGSSQDPVRAIDASKEEVKWGNIFDSNEPVVIRRNCSQVREEKEEEEEDASSAEEGPEEIAANAGLGPAVFGTRKIIVEEDSDKENNTSSNENDEEALSPLPQLARNLFLFSQNPRADWNKDPVLKAALQGKPKWNDDHTYLQAKCLREWCQEINNDDNPQILPKALYMKATQQGTTIINAFVNIQEAKRKAHFDVLDRFLLVEQGSIQVYVAGPTDYALEKDDYYDNSYNSDPFVKSDNWRTEPLWRKTTTLEAGQGLFVPAEWVRAVQSAPNTVVFAIKAGMRMKKG